MDKVRFGIIGLGNMGGLHLTWINEIPEVELTAVCDIDAKKADDKAKEYNVRSFHNAEELFASGCVDAVLIAVPHYSHTPLTIEAFRHGLHVLCEKPIAVTKSDAQKMIDEHAKHPELRFGLMFQQRTHEAHKKIKKLIDGGEFEEEAEVAEALRCPDMLEREEKLDAITWKKAEELSEYDYFNANTLLCYLVKLHIIERWYVLDPEKGAEMFRKLVEEVRGTFKGINMQ